MNSDTILLVKGQTGFTGADILQAQNVAGTRIAGITYTGSVFGTGAFIDLTSFAENKSNILPLEAAAATATVQALRPVSYHNDMTDRDDEGFLIDDLVTGFPIAVINDPEGKPQGYSATAIIAPLVAAVQSLLERVASLEARVPASA